MNYKISNQIYFRRGVVGTVALVLLVGVVAFWSFRRVAAQPSTASGASAAPVAGVARVTREDLFKEVKYLAEFRPYEEVELHAKISGYVSQMNVDFGDKVKAGQLLATLEVPELQADLDNARAAAMRAGADYTNAHLIYTRLLSVNRDHPNLVAQQELDTAAANDQTAAAAIAAAKAGEEKYQTMAGYTQITAPFDGVVTRRYADTGALVQAGTSSDTQARSLLRVSRQLPAAAGFSRNRGLCAGHSSRRAGRGAGGFAGREEFHRQDFTVHPGGGRRNAEDDHGDRSAQFQSGTGAGHVRHRRVEG